MFVSFRVCMLVCLTALFTCICVGLSFCTTGLYVFRSTASVILLANCAIFAFLVSKRGNRSVFAPLGRLISWAM